MTDDAAENAENPILDPNRMVHCAKLGETLPGLRHAPMKGELGQRLYEQVSAQAWKLWLQHSTMIINEYRLNPSEPKARETLRAQLEQFFFGDGAAPPPEFVAPPKTP